MKIAIFLLLLLPSTLMLSCSRGGQAPSTQQNIIKAPEVPKDGIYKSRGKVTKIDNELGSIELDHEEIPGLMPPMIMEFFVKDKSVLEGVEIGDLVNFDVEHKHPSETVVRIEKVK
jgi:Cu/Ag efflux protein CusF